MVECTAANTRCDPCRLASTRVHRCIHESLLECPKETYPVVFQISFKGSDAEAQEFIRDTKFRFQNTFKGGLPVYAAVREAAEGGGESNSPWHNIDYPMAVAQVEADLARYKPKRSNVAMRAGGFIGLQAPPRVQLQRFRTAGTRSKSREMTMLVDFPVLVQDGDSFDKSFRMNFGDKFEVRKRSSFSESGHASLHRLKWWSMVHPEEKPKE